MSVHTPHAPASAVLLTLASVGLFAGMDTSIRSVAGLLPVLLMLTVRYAVQAGSMAVYLALSQRRGFGSRQVRFQLLRGVLLLLASVCSFHGLRHLPVAEFTAITMLGPVLATALSAWWLHEPVSRLRWALVGGAFAGAVLLVRPGGLLFGWPALFPLGCALCVAFFQVLTRKMSKQEDPFTTHFWTGAVGFALMGLLMLATAGSGGAAQAMPPSRWGMMLLIGVLGTCGHLLLILALRRAPASQLTPIMYAQIAAAAMLAGAFLQQWPDAWSWAGMAVIGACGAGTVALNHADAASAKLSAGDRAAQLGTAPAAITAPADRPRTPASRSAG